MALFFFLIPLPVAAGPGLHGNHLAAPHVNHKSHKCPVRIFVFKGNISIGDGSVCAVYVAALDGNGNHILPRFHPEARHHLRPVGKLGACGYDLMYPAVFHPQVKAAPLYGHGSGRTLGPALRYPAGIHAGSFQLPKHSHIVLHFLIFVQVIVIDRSPSGHCLVGIKGHNGIKAKKAFQPIRDHIKF